MSATQELIAAAEDAKMSAPDIAEVERLLGTLSDHVFSDGRSDRLIPSPHSEASRTALLDAVRAIAAERDALKHDNERLMQIVSKEVSK
jgi:hypothetical protein